MINCSCKTRLGFVGQSQISSTLEALAKREPPSPSCCAVWVRTRRAVPRLTSAKNTAKGIAKSRGILRPRIFTNYNLRSGHYGKLKGAEGTQNSLKTGLC